MENKKTILIVDDDVDLCKVLSMRFSDAGYEPIEAHNGKETLNITKERRSDLIVLDIMLPQMDGMTISQRLKNDAQLKIYPLFS
ncbi:MAG: response regulator [Candidatus Omnitrophica bacterium]|nr:response regulator [Candidatus Omnitrophota bacterium]